MEWGSRPFYLDMLKKFDPKELEALRTYGFNSRYEEIDQSSYL